MRIMILFTDSLQSITIHVRVFMLLVFCNFTFFKFQFHYERKKKHTALVVKTVFAKVVIFKHHHVMYDIKMTKDKKKMMNVLIESKLHYPILIQIQLKTTYLNKVFFKIIFKKKEVIIVYTKMYHLCGMHYLTTNIF